MKNFYQPDMEVLFVEVRGSNQTINNGLAYLGGVLSSRLSYKIIDLNYLTWSEEKLKRYLFSQNPKILGFSVKSSNAQKIAALIKELRSEINSLIIVGGPHISLSGQEYLSANPGIDYGFSFEAETSLKKFLDFLSGACAQEEIPGLIYRTAAGCLSNPYIFDVDLDQIAFPDYDNFEGIDPKEYFSQHPYPLLTSRGCPYNCIYCSVKAVSGAVWRSRNIDNIIKELQRAQSKYNIKSFELVDDNFTLDLERAKHFCQALLESRLDLPWGCPNGLRADRITPELAKIMRQSGCHHISLGIESGEEKVFNNIKKGETLEDISRAVKILMAEGILVTGFFIVGLPYDNIASTKKTIKFYQQLKLNGGSKWNFLIPYPRTELWEWIEQNGTFLSDFSLGRHFSKTGHKMIPVFETPDFSARERLRAWKIANLSVGAYSYIFSIPKYKILFYLKAGLYLLVYTPEILWSKVIGQFRKLFKTRPTL